MTTWLRENRGLIVFLLCFGLFRTAVADWNPVPTGSMRPTILEGDVVLVNRLAYDLKLPLTDHSIVRLGEPRRGDVVTFSSPRNGMRLIKRVVALPGDTVELKGPVLIVNHVAAAYGEPTQVAEPVAPGMLVEATRSVERLADSQRMVQHFVRAGEAADFGPLVVPPDHYFMLGDNRDNSEDSRFIGVVPRSLLIGRAGRILVSADITAHWMPRLDRLWSPLH
ncbi:MAG: signal peptidase I [Ideonella sp.]|nr:signal peptidase I [Ideonella sp.]